MFTVSQAWRSAYPGATVGVLAMSGAVNPPHHAGLEAFKESLEADLRSRYAGYDRAKLKALPVLKAYNAYYKQFKKTYHVLHQIESVALKGKSIPRVAALVEAMFMAELKNLLLTAGHDLDIAQPPIGIDVASGGETYVRLSGQVQELKAMDMAISDREGVLSTIIYGPDQRTRIRPETRRVLFTVYGVPGVDLQAMINHLEDIRDNVMVVAPGAAVELLQVYSTE